MSSTHITRLRSRDGLGGGASGIEGILARGVHASFDLINNVGDPIYPRAEKLTGGSPAPVLAATLWSMSRVAAFRDVLATGEAECKMLMEVLASAALAAYPAAKSQRIEAMKPR